MTQCIVEAVRSGFKLGTGTPPLPNENMPLFFLYKKFKKGARELYEKAGQRLSQYFPTGMIKI